jgi:hypothetical protein
MRNNTAFGTNYPRPSVRDLDAWLLLDDNQLHAVECKHRTAAPIYDVEVPDEPSQLAAYARAQWIGLEAERINTDK